MAGHVAVRLVFVESDGSRVPSRIDWTAQQKQRVRAEIDEALRWWERNLPLAQLRFSVEEVTLFTGYEPIDMRLADEGLWIGDALRDLGLQGDNYFALAYEAADQLRKTNDSDWATTIFVVASGGSNGGRFADDYFAYAYIGGPFLVLTDEVGPYQQSDLAAVAAHEIAHIFGALDQYRAARVPCERRSGYLDQPTSNSQSGNCLLNEPSIMIEPVGSFNHDHIDPAALAQIGYRDSDGDGIIDPLDTTPELRLEAELAATNRRPSYRGSARDLAFPTMQQSATTINRIARVEYRINGGPWQFAMADDGSYDSAEEGFTAVPPLYDGTSRLEFRAVNTVGIASTITQTSVSISGVGLEPVYTIDAPPVSASPILTLSLQAAPGVAQLQLSSDPAFADAPWQLFQRDITVQLAAPGAYTYYLRFRDSEGLTSPSYPLLLRYQPPMPHIYLPLVRR
ncbi:hypothetical protein HC891_17840 [Candidatus Gracilibacteria bacterium]|nr:hypothetical protein [Candidatus Gracilibacteria bacterium]